MKKKLFFVLCVVFVGLILLPVLAACTPREEILKVYSWEEYIHEDFEKNDPAVNGFVDYYKKITGKNIKVQYQTFSENEKMLTKISAGGADYDVVCPSDYTFQKMLKNDLIQKLYSPGQVATEVDKLYIAEEGEEAPPKPADLEIFESNKGNVSGFIWEKVAELIAKDSPETDISEYFSPYMWGTMGILYNKDLVPDEYIQENGWGAIFNPAAEYEGKIYLKDSMRDTMAMAAIYNFKDRNAGKAMTPATVSEIMNVTAQADIDTVTDMLKGHKSKIYGLESEEGKPAVAYGDENVAMSLQWSGDAVWAKDTAAQLKADKEKGDYDGNIGNVGYYVPDEGSNIWFDGWCVPKNAANPLAANLWINYMNSPEAAIKNMEFIGYTSAVATKEVAEWCNTYYDKGNVNPDLSYFFGDFDWAYNVFVDIDQHPTWEVVNRCAVMFDYGDAQTAMENAWSAYNSYRV